MSNENDNNDAPEDTTETATAAVPDSPAPQDDRKFTQEDVNRFVKDAKKQARASERRKLEAAQPTENTVEQAPSVDPQVAAMAKKLADMEFRAAASEFGITDKSVQNVLRLAWQSSDEPAESWLAEHGKSFVRSEDKSQARDEMPVEAPRQPVTATSDNGAPTRPSALDGPVDLFKLSKDDIETLRRNGKLLDHAEKYRETLKGPGSTLFARRKQRK